jgi:hypothetical protein
VLGSGATRSSSSYSAVDSDNANEAVANSSPIARPRIDEDDGHADPPIYEYCGDERDGSRDEEEVVPESHAVEVCVHVLYVPHTLLVHVWT